MRSCHVPTVTAGGRDSTALAPFASAGSAPGGEVAGDHDADGLDPAGHVEHAAEAALGQHVVIGRGPRAGVGFAGRIFDAEKLEPLVVLIVAARHRSEVASPAAGDAGFVAAATVASLARSASCRGLAAVTGGAPPVLPGLPAGAAATAAPTAGRLATAIGRRRLGGRPRLRVSGRAAPVACRQRFVVEIAVGRG